MIPPPRRLVSGAQCRAARALLGWTQAHLAAEAGVARRTVVHFETEQRSLQRRILADITGALEGAGIELLNDGAGVEGVRLQPPRPPPDLPEKTAAGAPFRPGPRQSR